MKFKDLPSSKCPVRIGGAHSKDSDANIGIIANVVCLWKLHLGRDVSLYLGDSPCAENPHWTEKLPGKRCPRYRPPHPDRSPTWIGNPYWTKKLPGKRSPRYRPPHPDRSSLWIENSNWTEKLPGKRCPRYRPPYLDRSPPWIEIP